MTKKKPTGSRLVGMIVVLTKDSEAHHRQMREGWKDVNLPFGCKLLDTEGEVTSAWRDEGQWVQLRVLGGDHVGELITVGADQVKVVRASLDPATAGLVVRRAELLDVAVQLMAASRAGGVTGTDAHAVDCAIVRAKLLIAAVNGAAPTKPTKRTDSADYFGHDPTVASD